MAPTFHTCELPERGYWFAPALFTEASPAHRVAREEIFGPVLSITTFRTHAEAIRHIENAELSVDGIVGYIKGAVGDGPYQQLSL